MATPIKLADAAKFYQEQPHQERAWDWLEIKLNSFQLEGFQKMYRNEAGERLPGAPEDSPQEIEGICTPIVQKYYQGGGGGGADDDDDDDDDEAHDEL